MTISLETAETCSMGTEPLEILGFKDERELEARHYAWQMGAILALLINLKQATMVLVVLVLLATLFIVMRDSQISTKAFFRLLPTVILPAVFVYLVWRYHVSNELAARELSLRSFNDWHFYSRFHTIIPESEKNFGVKEELSDCRSCPRIKFTL